MVVEKHLKEYFNRMKDDLKWEEKELEAYIEKVKITEEKIKGFKVLINLMERGEWKWAK